MNYYGHAVRPAIRTYRREHIEPVAGQVRADSNRWEKYPTNPNPNIKSFNVLSVNEGYNYRSVGEKNFQTLPPGPLLPGEHPIGSPGVLAIREN